LIVPAVKICKNVCKLLQLRYRLTTGDWPLYPTGDFRPPDPLGY